jgi:hypothetical protein
MNRAEIRWSLACLIAAASAAAPGAGAKAQATPNVTQAGAAGAAGTLQPNGVAPAARDALFAAMDAWHRWAFTDAYEQANRAVMADSTFALARVYRTNIGGGTGSAASIAQYQRAIADAASRPAPEQTLVLAERFTGVNANRLYAASRWSRRSPLRDKYASTACALSCRNIPTCSAPNSGFRTTWSPGTTPCLRPRHTRR